MAKRPDFNVNRLREDTISEDKVIDIVTRIITEYQDSLSSNRHDPIVFMVLLHDLVSHADVLGKYRDILIRHMCRRGFTNTKIHRDLGIGKAIISRAVNG